MGRIMRWLVRKREANRPQWEEVCVRCSWIRATFFPGRKWHWFLLRVFVAYVLLCFLLSVLSHLLLFPFHWDVRIAVILVLELVIGRILRWLLPELPAILRVQMPSPPKPYREPPPPNRPGTSGSPSPVLLVAPVPTLEASRKLPVPSLIDAGARR